MYEDIERHLGRLIHNLAGSDLKKNSGYEGSICDTLNMQISRCRYWDAEWKHHYIEFKKGRSIWLDLVRYSEILLKMNKDASQETICLFFIPRNRARTESTEIEEIVCVETNKLIEAVHLNKFQAELLLQVKDSVPRSLNAQASLTVKDIREIKSFSVQNVSALHDRI